MFKRIVVGYDFAEGGSDALRRGAEIAIRRKCELVAAAAIDGKNKGRFKNFSQAEEAVSCAVRNALSELDLPKTGALQYRAAVSEGDAAEAILRASEEAEAGLIIIGGARRSLSERVIGGIVQPAALGAVASKIISRNPQRPLLIERGGANLKIKKILVAADIAPECDELVSLASNMAAEYMAELYILHVCAPPVFTLGSFGAALKKRKAENESRFNAYLERLKPSMRGVEANPILLDGDPASQAAAACKRLGIDLAIAGLKPPKGVHESVFGNFASKLAAGTKSSVMLAPVQIEARKKALQLDLARRSG